MTTTKRFELADKIISFLVNIINENESLGPMTYEIEKLLRQYQQAKASVNLLDELSDIHNRLRDDGYQVVSSVFKYNPTYFHTRLSLSGTESEQDHAVLDAIREIMVEWSNSRHNSKLAWNE